MISVRWFAFYLHCVILILSTSICHRICNIFSKNHANFRILETSSRLCKSEPRSRWTFLLVANARLDDLRTLPEISDQIKTTRCLLRSRDYKTVKEWWHLDALQLQGRSTDSMIIMIATNLESNKRPLSMKIGFLISFRLAATLIRNHQYCQLFSVTGSH